MGYIEYTDITDINCPLCKLEKELDVQFNYFDRETFSLEEDQCRFCPWRIFEGNICSEFRSDNGRLIYDNNIESIKRLNSWLDILDKNPGAYTGIKNWIREE
jgi:hypothetical protein